MRANADIKAQTQALLPPPRSRAATRLQPWVSQGAATAQLPRAATKRDRRKSGAVQMGPTAPETHPTFGMLQQVASVQASAVQAMQAVQSGFQHQLWNGERQRCQSKDMPKGNLIL